MRILIVHNQLWAHYKSLVFSEIHKVCQQYNNTELLVLQIALCEGDRQALGNDTAQHYYYPYHLLFNTSLERVTFWPKLKKLLAEIRAFKPNVVNLTGYYDPAQLVVLLYCKLAGIKTILSNESSQQDRTRRGLKEQLKKKIVRSFDGYFCFGKTSVDYLIQLGADNSNILTTKGAVVDNTALLDIYQKASPNRPQLLATLQLRPRNFIFVGRLVEIKNLKTLLQSYQNLIDPTHQWGLIFLGEGTQKAELQAMVNTHQTEGVVFLDGQPWYKVPEYLALADVLVLPSWSEPWGLVVNEAMVCGLPVIASDVCGCVPDLVIENETGYLFDPKNGEELTQKMQKFVSCTANYNALSQQAVLRVAEFSPAKAALQMFEGFERVVTQTPILK